MKIVIVESYEEMSMMAANLVKNQVIAKPKTVLGLAAGNTPLGMYKELAMAYKRGAVDFSQITTFNLDEYSGLGPDHRQSYHYYMNQNFFSQINIQEQNIYIPNGMTDDIEKECTAYDEKILKKGGIDLQILGIGENGHIGFNEPNPDFIEKTHLVKLNPTTVEANSIYFDSTDDVPTYAITMGIKNILESKMLILMASGEDKAEAIHKAIKGEITPQVPASILQSHPNAVFIIDKSASILLQSEKGDK
jgi:glucosamine-6-phosphate deaminase